MRDALGPAKQQEWTVLDVVVRMMVGDEDGADGGEWDSGAGELGGDAEAAIDDVSRAVADEDMRGHVARAAFDGTGAGAEQDEAGSGGVAEGGLGALRGPFGRCGFRHLGGGEGGGGACEGGGEEFAA